MPADVDTNSEHGIQRKPERSGLHFCRRYMNVVRYEPEFCGRCPFNGLRPSTSSRSETRF